MIYISIGSNMGNRFSHLQKAAQLLQERYFKNLKSSIILETKAILPNDAPPGWDRPFLNMVVYGSCSSSPEELLKGLNKLNVTLAVCRSMKNGHLALLIWIFCYGMT